MDKIRWGITWSLALIACAWAWGDNPWWACGKIAGIGVVIVLIEIVLRKADNWRL